MYSEENLMPLSALQHLMFCERQCALIHLEQAWTENRFTAEGRVLHERVHELDAEQRGDVRIVRGLRIRTHELGLIGQADVVEFWRTADGGEQPFPVEFKRGRPKPNECDEIQLCAQALCLEEMLDVSVVNGAIFYGKPRRRHPVSFDSTLRRLTETKAERLHELMKEGITPPAVYEKRKCETCSLYAQCQPKTNDRPPPVGAYLKRMIME